MPSLLRRAADRLSLELIIALLALAALILLLIPVHFSARSAEADIPLGLNSNEGLFAGGVVIALGLTCIATMLRPWPALALPLIPCALLLPFAAIGVMDLATDLTSSGVSDAICPGSVRYEEQPDLVSHFPGTGCVGHSGFFPLPDAWLALVGAAILTPAAIALRVPGRRWARMTSAVVAAIVVGGVTLLGSLIAALQHLE
jgi:hypothetical protein